MKESSVNNSEFILISEYFHFFKRNSITLLIFIILGILLGALVPIRKEWVGKSNLLFNSDKTYSSISGSPSEYFINAKSNPYQNSTSALKITSEDSFLFKIYEYYKKLNIVNDSNFKIESFKNWKNRLKISHNEKKKVITFKFIGTNKENISSTLKKINEDFKAASHLFKEEYINKSLVTYRNLISAQQIKTDAAIKKLYSFSLANNFNDQFLTNYFVNTLKNLQQRNDGKTIKIELESNDSKIKNYDIKEYNNLIRNLSLNSSILDRLIYEESLLKLEKNIVKDPWYLNFGKIILEKENKSLLRNLSIGFLSGILIGTILSIIKEFRKNIIYTSLEFEDNTLIPIVTEIELNERDQTNLNIFKEIYLKELNSKVLFITTNSDFDKIKDTFLKILETKIPLKNIDFTSNIIETINYDISFLVVKKGLTKRKEFNNLIKSLTFAKSNILGLIITS